LAESAGNEDMRMKAYFRLGTLYFLSDDYGKAIEAYQIVMQEDTSGKYAVDATYNFAIACKTIGNYSAAVEAYQLLTERFPEQMPNKEALFEIAYCYFSDKKYSKAIEIFTQAFPHFSSEKQAEIQYWIGESYFGMENFEQAAIEFLKVSYMYSHDAQLSVTADLRAGLAYEKLEQWNKAAGIYHKIVKKYGASSQWGKEAQQRLGQIEG